MYSIMELNVLGNGEEMMDKREVVTWCFRNFTLMRW